jgi:hypothetical protein
MSRQLKRQLSKLEENEKKAWNEAYAAYTEETAEPARNPMESYKKRRLQRPPMIVPKKIPQFKYNKFINVDPKVLHFLDTALVVLINAENIQSWFFDKTYVAYFHTDLECGDRATNIVRRMIEIAQNPETPRDEEIDPYIEQISRVSRTIEAPSKIPDVYKFALHILAQNGHIPDRLRLLSASPAELADFISAVIQKPIAEKSEEKWVIETDDEEDEERSDIDDVQRNPIGGGAIIDLVDEDLPLNWRKIHFDEIIDLVSSSSDEE